MKRLEFIKKLLGLGALALLPLGLLKPVEERKKTCLLKFVVKGFQYYEGPDLIGSMRIGECLSLVREPGNKFDRHAIAIHYKNQKIGFVPRGRNEVLSRLLDTGIKDLSAELLELNEEAFSWDAVNAGIYIRG